MIKQAPPAVAEARERGDLQAARAMTLKGARKGGEVTARKREIARIQDEVSRERQVATERAAEEAHAADELKMLGLDVDMSPDPTHPDPDYGLRPLES